MIRNRKIWKKTTKRIIRWSEEDGAKNGFVRADAPKTRARKCTRCDCALSIYQCVEIDCCRLSCKRVETNKHTRSPYWLKEGDNSINRNTPRTVNWNRMKKTKCQNVSGQSQTNRTRCVAANSPSWTEVIERASSSKRIFARFKKSHLFVRMRTQQTFQKFGATIWNICTIDSQRAPPTAAVIISFQKMFKFNLMILVYHQNMIREVNKNFCNTFKNNLSSFTTI